MSRKINKARFFAQARTSSLKYMAPLKAGTVLTVKEVIEGVIPQEGRNDLENDQMLCTDSDGALIKIPVREFANMTFSEGSSAYSSEGDSEDLELPAQLTIVSSVNREVNGAVSYPLFAYKGAQEFLDADQADRDWASLVASGVKDDNTYSPVQNYTISTK